MTVLERRMNALERYQEQIIGKREYIAKFADELKDPENDSYVLLDITTKIQGFILEIKELEMQIRFTEREINLIKQYENQ
jgi:hypothetical protein